MRLKSIFSTLLSLVFFWTNVLGGVLPDTLWSQRGPRTTIIHIQDIHSNIEAQADIARLLQELIQKNQIDLVGLEGSSKIFNLTKYHSFPYQDILKTASKELMEENEISGAFHALLITPNRRLNAFGLEDESTYRKNIEAYLAAAPHLEKVRADARKKKAWLQQEKSKTFNPELLNFDRIVQSYRENQINLETYLRKLLPQTTIHAPEVNKFLDGTDIENGVDLQMDYQQIVRSLNAEKLFEEIQALERDIYQRLATTKKEKQLISLCESQHLTQKLIDFELTFEEWSAYKKNPNRDVSHRSFERFYQVAEHRNTTMAKRLLSALNQKSARTAVIVTGGFHSKGMDSIFEQAGYTVLTYTPHVADLNGPSNVEYLSGFEKILASTLARPPDAGAHKIFQRCTQLGTEQPTLSLPVWNKFRHLRQASHKWWFAPILAPLLEIWMLPGLGLGLEIFLPFWSAIPIASLVTARLHGSLPEGPENERSNEYDQTWKQFWMRALGAALINTLSLGVLHFLPGDVLWHAYAVAFGTGVVAHGVWNAAVKPENRLNLFTIKKALVHPKPEGTKEDRKKNIAQLIDQIKSEFEGIEPIFPPEFGFKFDAFNYQTVFYLPKIDASFPLIRQVEILGEASGKSLYLQIDGAVYSIKEDTRLTTNILPSLARLLRGDELELLFQEEEQIFIRNWDDWKPGTSYYDLYRKNVDPLVIQVIMEELQARGDKPATILDLAGGDGVTMASLNQAVSGRRDIPQPTVIVVDEMKNVGEKLSQNEARKIQLRIDAQTHISNEVGTQADIVVVAGFLSHGILAQTEAMDIGRSIFEAMKDGGLLVLTGTRAPLLSAADLEYMGFEVINMSIPAHVAGPWYPKHFYVARKPTPVLTGLHKKMLTLLKEGQDPNVRKSILDNILHDSGLKHLRWEAIQIAISDPNTHIRFHAALNIWKLPPDVTPKLLETLSNPPVLKNDTRIGKIRRSRRSPSQTIQESALQENKSRQNARAALFSGLAYDQKNSKLLKTKLGSELADWNEAKNNRVLEILKSTPEDPLGFDGALSLLEWAVLVSHWFTAEINKNLSRGYAANLERHPLSYVFSALVMIENDTRSDLGQILYAPVLKLGLRPGAIRDIFGLIPPSDGEDTLSLSVWKKIFGQTAGKRWFTALMVPILEIWMLPGLGLGLEIFLPFWSAIPIASLVTARLHGSLPEGPENERSNEYDQTWKQFWMRALGAALINTLSLGVLHFLPGDVLWHAYPVSFGAGIVAHGAWNALTPSLFWLSLPERNDLAFNIKNGVVVSKSKETEELRKATIIEIAYALINDNQEKTVNPSEYPDIMNSILHTPSGETFYISKIDPAFGNIRMVQSKTDRTKNFFYFEKKKILLLIDDTHHDFHDRLGSLLRRLKGDEFELDHSDRTVTPVYFSHWLEWDENAQGYQHYRDNIDPVVLKAILDVLNKKPEQTHCIVDLAGGDGRLLHRLIKEVLVGKHTRNHELHLIEQTRIAQRNPSPRIRIHNRRMGPQIDIEKTVGQKPTVVISEGFLSLQVLPSKQEAMSIAKNIFQALEKDGTFILTGFTPSLLNSKDLTDIGFIVTNMSVPSNFADISPPSQLYICRKPGKNTAATFVLEDNTVVPQFRGTEEERKRRVVYAAEQLIASLKAKAQKSAHHPEIETWKEKLRKGKKGITIDLRHYNSQLPRIRSWTDDDIDPSDHRMSFDFVDLPELNITIKTNPNDREIFTHLTELLNLISGIDLELNFSVDYEHTRGQKYWKEWTTGAPYITYRQNIDPILTTFLLQKIDKSENAIHILDLGGGDGSLLANLQEHLPRGPAKKTPNLYLWDQSENIGVKVRGTNVQLIHDDATQTMDFSSRLGQKLDIVVAAGLMNELVLSAEDSKKVAQSAFRSLNEGGLLVLTGFTYSMLSSTDLQEMGFEILNMSIPSNFSVGTTPDQLYIARKPKKNTDAPVTLPLRELGTVPMSAPGLFDLHQVTQRSQQQS